MTHEERLANCPNGKRVLEGMQNYIAMATSDPASVAPERMGANTLSGLLTDRRDQAVTPDEIALIISDPAINWLSPELNRMMGSSTCPFYVFDDVLSSLPLQIDVTQYPQVCEAFSQRFTAEEAIQVLRYARGFSKPDGGRSISQHQQVADQVALLIQATSGGINALVDYAIRASEAPHYFRAVETPLFETSTDLYKGLSVEQETLHLCLFSAVSFLGALFPKEMSDSIARYGRPSCAWNLCHIVSGYFGSPMHRQQAQNGSLRILASLPNDVLFEEIKTYTLPKNKAGSAVDYPKLEAEYLSMLLVAALHTSTPLAHALEIKQGLGDQFWSDVLRHTLSEHGTDYFKSLIPVLEQLSQTWLMDDVRSSKVGLDIWHYNSIGGGKTGDAELMSWLRKNEVDTQAFEQRIEDDFLKLIERPVRKFSDRLIPLLKLITCADDIPARAREIFDRDIGLITKKIMTDLNKASATSPYSMNYCDPFRCLERLIEFKMIDPNALGAHVHDAHVATFLMSREFVDKTAFRKGLSSKIKHQLVSSSLSL